MTQVLRSEFKDNTAWGYGGAIYFDKQRFNIGHSTFVSNNVLTADQLFCDTPAAGGAIYISYSAAVKNTIAHTNFTQNSAVTGWGGAIFATENSEVIIRHSYLANNFAVSSYTNAAQGGAVMVTSQSTLRITRSILRGNFAVPYLNKSPMTYSGNGGAIFAQSSSVHVEESQIIRNYAFTGQFDGGSTGGGIVLENCYPAVVSLSTFSQNGAVGFLGRSSYASCGTGGGIYVKFSSAIVNDTIFTENWASAGGKQNSIGGAVAVYFDYASVEGSSPYGVQINRTVFENNTAFGQICYRLQAGSGGALGIVGAAHPPVVLHQTNFTTNTALGSATSTGISGLTAEGGAVSASLNSNVSVSQAYFYDNAALFGMGDDFASISAEENEENFLEFDDTIFHSTNSAGLLEREYIVSQKGTQLCTYVQSLLSSYRTTTTLSSTSATKHVTNRRRLFPEEMIEVFENIHDDLGFHIYGIGKKYEKKNVGDNKKTSVQEESETHATLRVFNQDVRIPLTDLFMSDEDLYELEKAKEDSEILQYLQQALDEEVVAGHVRRALEQELMETFDKVTAAETEGDVQKKKDVLQYEKVLRGMLQRMKVIEAANALKEEKVLGKLPLNAAATRVYTPPTKKSTTESALNENEAPSRELRSQLPSSSMKTIETTSMLDDFIADLTSSNHIVTFINRLPDFVATRGRCVLRNPTFEGDYHIFVGDYDQFVSAKSSSSSSSSSFLSKAYYRSTTEIVGNILVDDLTLTMVNADIFTDVIDVRDVDTLRLKQLNVFNSSVSFSSNIVVSNSSFLLDVLFIGYDKANVGAREVMIRPNLTFEAQVFTGYTLPEIFDHEETTFRPVIHEFKGSNLNASNQSYVSLQQYRSCNVLVSGQMVLDSPYHAIDVFFGAITIGATEYTFFSNSRISLQNNATMTVTKGGQLSLLTSTLVESDNSNDVALYNFGDVSLLGTTVSLAYILSDTNPTRIPVSVAKSGSLGSKLTVLGNYVQGEEGKLSVFLNYSSQHQPVVYLQNNRSLSGTIHVDFFGTKNAAASGSSTELAAYCPNLVLGDDPSQFTVISYLDTSDSSIHQESSSFNRRYYALSPAKVSTTQGITFSTNVQPHFIAGLNQVVQNQVLTVESIACENIFAYYSGVAASSTLSKYPCHICLQNTSCALYVNAGGQQQCALRGLPPADYPEQVYSSNCCGGCAKGGTCVASPNYEAFTCEYNCNWFYSKADNCQSISTDGLVVIFVGSALFAILAGIYWMYQRTEKQKEQVLEELREGILRHTATANNEYIQDMQQALILNDVFVKYDELKIESKVGEGSFGVVHKATFRGAQVAVKQMRSMFLEITDKDIEEFRKEAYMMSRLRHPNIVLVMGITLVELEPVQPKSRAMNSIMDSDMMATDNGKESGKEKDGKKKPKTQKTVCIITEYLEQGSLSDILYGPTRLPPEIFTYELILTIALQAARGMLYLHSHQPAICHRDLKSSNLVVDDHWVVKVTDFGMSRIVPERVQDEDKGVGDDYERDSIGRDSIADPSASDAPVGTKHSSISLTNSNPRHSSFVHNVNNANNVNTRVSGNNTVSSPDGQTFFTSHTNLEMTSNLGTTAWCAPEVLTSSSRARYSIKVDVYSYGMVLWELWEKKRPFEEYTSRFDITDAVKAGKRPAISEHCPPTYKALIKRCWQTEPSRRPTFNYIVRYLKDELARVKRSKVAVSAGQFSNLQQQQQAPRAGSMSAYLRSSFSTNNNHNNYNNNNNVPGGSRQSLSQVAAALADTTNRPSFSFMRFSTSSVSNKDKDSNSVVSNPLASAPPHDLESGDLRAEDVGMSPVPSVSNYGTSYLEERRLAEANNNQNSNNYNSNNLFNSNNSNAGGGYAGHVNSANTSTQSHSQLTAAVAAAGHSGGGSVTSGGPPTVAGMSNSGNTLNNSNDALRNLPEGRTPLVAAFDRSLSYLTESPAVSTQPFRPYQKYGGGGGGANNTWRDKYVMQFSGWNSANPDAGLPPSASRQQQQQQQMSFSPASSPSQYHHQQQQQKLMRQAQQQRSSLPNPRATSAAVPAARADAGQQQVQQQQSFSVSPVVAPSIHSESSADAEVFTMDDDATGSAPPSSTSTRRK